MCDCERFGGKEMVLTRLRMKPNVAVADAMSRGRTLLWSAMRGAWKFGPTPMPAMIWKRMMRGQLAEAGKLM